jgi:hypothetical protein
MAALEALFSSGIILANAGALTTAGAALLTI